MVITSRDKSPKGAVGFTLVELLTVMAILGILVAIAIPMYNRYQRTGYRASGKATLLSAAQYMERYFTRNNTYVEQAAPNNYKFQTSSEGNGYAIAVDAGNTSATTFRLTATPQGNQVDDKCGVLSVNHLGQKQAFKGATDVTSGCW